jgi:hypothetical protein
MFLGSLRGLMTTWSMSNNETPMSSLLLITVESLVSIIPSVGIRAIQRKEEWVRKGELPVSASWVLCFNGHGEYSQERVDY